METSKRVLAVSVTFTLMALLLVAPLQTAHAESVGSWTSTTKYPLALAGESCVAFSSSVYCIGGFGGGGNSHNQVYHASLGASGIGTWSAGTAYPTPVDSAACVNATAGIYCVGGEDYPNNISNVYFAPFSSSGLGAWSSETPYPNALAGMSCVVYGGYIYCVGGFDSNGDEVSSTYYASLSSGLTSWSGTTQYPLAVDRESCTASAGYIYCVAGEMEVDSNQNNPVTYVYYAPLSSSGIGQWTATLSYPTALTASSCAQYSGYVYCIGGFDSSELSSADSYFGPTTSTGIASWTDLPQYPVAIDTSSCVADLGYLFCIAGNSVTQSSQSTLNPVNFAYYAPISGASTQTSTTPEFPLTLAIPTILALALVAVAGMGRLYNKKR